MSAPAEHRELFRKMMGGPDPLHAAMDDMARWGTRLTEAHLDRRIAESRGFVPQGCDQQGRLEPTIPPAPAEACTDVGAEPEVQRKRRIGPLGPVGRWVIRNRVGILLACVAGICYLLGRP